MGGCGKGFNTSLTIAIFNSIVHSMKNILLIAVLAVFASSVSTAKAVASPEEQLLVDLEKAGVSYVVPQGHANMGTFSGELPYVYLHSQDDFTDSYAYMIRVYLLTNAPTLTTKLKNINTAKQAEALFLATYPFASNEKYISMTVKVIGTEKFIIMEMTRTLSDKTLHFNIAHVVKNNKLYAVEFVDNVESYTKNIVIYENFLKTFKVTDLSKKAIPFVGKAIALQGVASSLTFNIPQGFSAREYEVAGALLFSNMRNKMIEARVSDTDAVYYQDFLSAKTNADLVRIASARSEFTTRRTDNGAGNSYLSNAYIKTYNGQKVYVVNFEVKSVPTEGGTVPPYNQTNVYVFKNGTLYTFNFSPVDTFNDKHIEELLKTIKVKDLRKAPVLTKTAPIAKVVTPVKTTLPTAQVLPVATRINKTLTVGNPITVSYLKPTGYTDVPGNSGDSKGPTYETLFYITSFTDNFNILASASTESSFDMTLNIFNAHTDAELANLVQKRFERDRQSGWMINTVTKAYITKLGENTFYIYEYTATSPDGMSPVEIHIDAYTRAGGYVFGAQSFGYQNIGNTKGFFEYLSSIHVVK